MRQSIKFTEAEVTLPDGEVIAGRFRWRRNGQAAKLIAPDRVLLLHHAATYRDLAGDGTRIEVTGDEGTWVAERIDNADCGCTSKRRKSKT